jgi:hypothetical protein
MKAAWHHGGSGVNELGVHGHGVAGRLGGEASSDGGGIDLVVGGGLAG